MAENNILKIRDDERIELSCNDKKFTITNNQEPAWLGQNTRDIFH